MRWHLPPMVGSLLLQAPLVFRHCPRSLSGLGSLDPIPGHCVLRHKSAAGVILRARPIVVSSPTSYLRGHSMSFHRSLPLRPPDTPHFALLTPSTHRGVDAGHCSLAKSLCERRHSAEVTGWHEYSVLIALLHLRDFPCLLLLRRVGLLHAPVCRLPIRALSPRSRPHRWRRRSLRGGC